MTDLVRWAEHGDAAAVADRIAAELARRGPKRIALPGGSTPLKIFGLLAERGLDWSGATLTLTDDRRVPDDHPASNHGKLRAALPGVAIERLEEGAEVAPFDLVWLGMGEDGHVASLFPHMRAELRPGPRVIATTPIPLPAEAPFDRLSLNWRALLATREVILVVIGEAKRRVIEAALAKNGDGADLPVATLFNGAGVPNPPPITIYWSA